MAARDEKTGIESCHSFSLASVCGRLAEISKPHSEALIRLSKAAKWTEKTEKEFFSIVARVMLDAENNEVNKIAITVSPFLLHVLERTLDEARNIANTHDQHVLICILLGNLVRTHPVALQFAIRYFSCHPPPFEQTPDEHAEPKPKRIKTSKKTDVLLKKKLVLSCYNFVLASDSFASQWSWGSFYRKFMNDTSPEIRWLACQCLAIVSGMSESQRSNFVTQHVSRELDKKFTLHYVLENQNRHNLSMDHASGETSESGLARLSDQVVNIEGVLLPYATEITRSEKIENPYPLVYVQSTKRLLQSLSLAISSGSAVLLAASVGSGKTSIVEHLAGLTGRTVKNRGLLKVQLSDQTDSRTLVGTYQATDVPGEFVWTAGILTLAVREGRWLLLEDIDYAPMDVVSLLLPLLESRTLNVPGHGDVIQAHSGFQLFATQRTVTQEDGRIAVRAVPSSVLDQLWVRIVLDPLSRDELRQIIQLQFPKLTLISERILDVYFLLSSGRVDGEQVLDVKRSKATDRSISPRDLFKWCMRMSSMFDKDSSVLEATSQLYVFQDALDCFVAAVLEPEHRLVLSEFIGSRLNLLKQKVEFYEKTFKPNINSSDEKFSVGRVTLTKLIEDSLLKKALKTTFSWTRPSTVLLERLAVCVKQNEPVLLVGETGTGKTSTIQYLAQQLGQRLVVINLNQQSDSADLLGGYKPVDLKAKVSPLREEFEGLFCSSFSRNQNAKFLAHIATCFANRRWDDLLKLMTHSLSAAVQRFQQNEELKLKWEALGYKLQQLRVQLSHSENVLAFSFVEGSLVKALKAGDWVLLDEINLATAETLECLSGVLESQEGSVYLFDRGDRLPVARSSSFRLFAAMNPATDVGKKQLPQGLRSRFTEFFVDEITASADLTTLVGDYLRELSLTTAQVEGIVRFYLHIRNEALKNLTDGTGHKPHFSLRTLCRALSISSSNPCGNVLRSLYEAFCLSFLTQLDRKSHPIVEDLVVKFIVGKKNLKSILGQKLAVPRPLWSGQNTEDFIEVSGYWIPRGDLEAFQSESYIVTSSVSKNLRDLARVVSIGRLPVLLQGETSVGKTSLISYLAQLTGNKCLRVNNHEHTDLQEYVGSYTADETGKLIFREGVLVTAMRRGYWIILDELNLAPSEVLEALNRVLDDNRELFITETQEVVKAHPRFLLFATQNPPGGHYGGRKMLSRAFRNRFVELHFDEIPPDELEVILHRRCAMPPSYCKKLVAVLLELQLRRRGSAAFAGKQGFMTLRDLFRWAERYRKAADFSDRFYDWEQHLADEGYLVIAGRVRKEEEVAVICEVLEKHFKRKVDPGKLFTLSSETSAVTRPFLEAIHQNRVPEFQHLVWTYSLRRLAVLVGQALRFHEPVLMVGDTGCGKTSVCQWLAAHMKRDLFTVNCHQYSEGADFLGGLRPVRDRSGQQDGDDKFDRLFEWVDGPLVRAMKEGHFFLADEISLADDSVLERLNSVLEPERTLLLAEKAAGLEPEVITALDEFRFFGTMNPGGDFGKKELSPALRNRLTEIWCPMSRDRRDIVDIVEHNLRPGLRLSSKSGAEPDIGQSMVDFIQWFGTTDIGARVTISIRDVLSWVQFMNTATGKCALDTGLAYIHGACLVFLDALSNARHVVDTAIGFLASQVERKRGTSPDVSAILTGMSRTTEIISSDAAFGIAPFFIAKGDRRQKQQNLFTFQAPSTSINLVRLLRALQLNKPLLLEGSPGVGKTSLVAALAQASGNELVRINLSEQTDVSDLFGADLPVEGSDVGGHFEWRDGPLLRALKAGHWVVLDELNLASQSVLEGLNAVLDHRGELYIPELGKRFFLQGKTTKIFACQNPLKQGGARKGLPKSFLNRFTQVYVEALERDDLEFIATAVFPSIDPATISRMVAFNERLVKEILNEGLWGLRGGPWELNLRDIFRWCEAMKKYKTDNPGEFVHLIYGERMRTKEDKAKVEQVYQELFYPVHPLPGKNPFVYATQTLIQVGGAALARATYDNPQTFNETYSSLGKNLCVLHRNLGPLSSLMHCVNFNWMAILVGAKASGKTSLVRLLAQLAGQPLDVLTMNSAMDTTELLGGFEQGDLNRSLEDIASAIEGLSQWSLRASLLEGNDMDLVDRILKSRLEYRRMASDIGASRSLVEDSEHFRQKAEILAKTLRDIEEFGRRHDRNIEGNISSLKDHLEKVTRLASDSGTVSIGGRFEWIDSLLVKALRQGRWLLVENVNLCSPSVLDRLNGLLEPNGVLTLNERGIINGEIPTIVPHPNFRLFLTLDPRFGEISRAMRNRGLEVYLLDPVEDPYDDHDLAAALQCAGLTVGPLQRALLDVHQALLEDLPLSERPTLKELLSAASLTAQRLERLFASPLTALMDTCVEVYVKNLRLPESRIAAQAVVSRVLECGLWSESLIIPYAPVSGRQVQLSSATAIVKQSASVIQRLVESTPSLSLSSEGEEALCEALLLFYWTSSPDDVALRYNYVEHLFARNEVDSIYVALNKELYEKSSPFSQSAGGENPQLPWDPRWYDQLCRLQLGFRKHGNNPQTGHMNRLSAYLWWRAKTLMKSSAPKSSSRSTFAAFARAISHGALAEEAAPHPVLVSLPAFIKRLDDTIDELLTSPRLLIDNDAWSGLIEALWWRLQLKYLDDLPVTREEMDDTLAQIAQSWMWLSKNTMTVIKRLDTVTEILDKEASKVTEDLAINGDGRCVLARRLRRHLQLPEPFVGENEAATFRLCSTLTALSDFKIFASAGGQVFARKLSSLEPASAEEELKTLQREEINHAAVSSRHWPLIDHLIALRCLALLAHRTPQIEADCSAVTLAGQLLRIALPHQQYFTFWGVIGNVSSARHPLQWIGDETESNRFLSNAPVVSLITSAVLGGQMGNQASGVSLGLQDESSKLLSDLKAILWYNCENLHNEWYHPVANEQVLAVDVLKKLVEAMCRSAKIDIADDLMDSHQWQLLVGSLISAGVPGATVRVVEMAWHRSRALTKSQTPGSLWLLIGLARCVLLSPLENIDPVDKRKRKNQLRSSRLKEMSSFVNVFWCLKEMTAGKCDLECQHPHLQHFAQRQTELELLEREESQRKPTWRPRDSLYVSIRKDLAHYSSTVASTESVLSLLKKIEDFIERCRDKKCGDPDLVLSEAELWLSAQRSFYHRLQTKYATYPDLIVPVLMGIAEMCHGVESLIAEMKKIVDQQRLPAAVQKDPDTFLANLIDFPSRLVAVSDSGLVAVAEKSISPDTQSLVNVVFEEEGASSAWKVFLQSALMDVVKHASVSRRVDADAWRVFASAAAQLVSAWNAAEERKRLLELEQESLFKNKTKIHEGEASDAELSEKEVSEYFPSYDDDFNDDASPTSMETDANQEMEFDDFDQDDLLLISQCHVTLLSQWVKSLTFSPLGFGASDQSHASAGFALRQRYAGTIVKRLASVLGTQFDRRSITSLIYVLNSRLSRAAVHDNVVSRATYDFYRDPYVAEAEKCTPVLRKLTERVEELLAEWPGHATLEDIVKLTRRILSFDVDSPLMKLVTGLELLLSKSQEWEVNAHRGVSLAEHLQSISNLILQWRSMELDSWKGCLDSVEKRVKASAAKLWFHLYSSIETHLRSDSDDDIHQLQKILRHFMESSSLGEYDRRLEMLWAFMAHVEMDAETPNARRQNLLCILWHTTLFYGQFREAVIGKRSAIRQPIEKKVRDFVKIMRWNDINYFALKEAVAKAHHTLRKFMKELQTALQQPAKSAWNDNEQDPGKSQSTWSLSVQTNLFIFQRKILEDPLILTVEIPKFLSRLPSLARKSQNFSSAAMKLCPIAKRISAIDDLTGRVIATADDLQKLQVIGGPDKEKQKAEARLIAHRKRQSLSELFRLLQKLGLSYRRGSTLSKDPKDLFQRLLPVMDVSAALDSLPQRPGNANLKSAWNRGPLYFSRCFARLAVLFQSLEKPSAELGPANLERCRGFAAHFNQVIQDQWRQSSLTLSQLTELRLLLEQFQSAASPAHGRVPAFLVVRANFQDLWRLAVDGVVVLEDLLRVLEAKPDPQTVDDSTLYLMEQESGTLDGLADKIQTVSGIVSRIASIKSNLEVQFQLPLIANRDSFVYSANQWECVLESYLEFRTICKDLRDLTQTNGEKGIFGVLSHFAGKVEKTCGKFDSRLVAVDQDSRELHVDDCDAICACILQRIQSFYKKYGEVSEFPEENADTNSDDEEEFDHNYLTSLIIDQIRGDIVDILKIDPTIQVLTKLFSCTSGKSSSKLQPLLAQMIPIIDQYIGVVEYYFTLQLASLRTSCKFQSVLLNLFNELALKGFCLPTELEENDKQGDSKLQEIESGGLGEGEGAKDVSDQIENEDQLEDARRGGDQPEDQPEGSGPKEEENAIEMSEDFDADLQDRDQGDKGEDEEGGDENQDEEEHDKQMGDLQGEGDSLEEKLWGSDEEDDADEEDEKEDKDAKGDGKRTESELTAKEGDKENDDQEEESGNGDEKKKEKRKDINEMDEENFNDDQVDPYHGQQEPQPEPEALDLPEDLNLDGGDPQAENGNPEEEENPFDIDKMKEDVDKPDEVGDDENGKEEDEAMETEEKIDEGTEKDEPVDKNKEMEKTENDDESEDGGEEDGEKETVEKDEEDEEKNLPENQSDEATPSQDTPTEKEAEPAADQSQKGTKDRTAQKEEPMETDEGGRNDEADNEDNEGVGVSESRESKGHEGQESSTAHRPVDDIQSENLGKEKPKKPGQSDPDRALGSRENEKFLQVHAKDRKPQAEENDEGLDDSSSKQVDQHDVFEHVKGVEEKYDAVTRDAATEDQAKEQPVADNEKTEEDQPATDDVDMKEDDPEAEAAEEESERKEAEKITSKSKRQRGDFEQKTAEDLEQLEDQPMDVEGEAVATLGAARGSDSCYVTQVDLLRDLPMTADSTVEDLRADIEQRLSTWSAQPEVKEGEETWRQLETITYGLAQDLCEQLRLILEPSQASRLKGDYRTGKRINMRKVIPYIASQFRKDRIWLRRTKPAKRSYQIVLAVDDSSSMSDNRSKELAFESVALISKALSLLEAGQLGVVSFGEDVNLLHTLDEPFSDNSGARVLQQFTFAQKKTRIAHLLDFVTALLSRSRTANNDSETAQLLLIVSDGRGLFSEGADAVQQAIRRARQARIFMVFVIIDNPESKDSILDIRMPIFGGPGQLMEIKPYLDCFPFPFYVILRNIQALPTVLSDALRQWFELVTCSSS